MELTPKTNRANRKVVADEWNLGPQVATVDPEANGDFWGPMAERWQVSEPEARRRLCANCEYFDNSTGAQEAMEAVALDKFDQDGGGRGYCEKFDFICHNLRVCQAWEPKDADEGGKWAY